MMEKMMDRRAGTLNAFMQGLHSASRRSQPADGPVRGRARVC